MNVRNLSVALGALSLLATGAVYAQDPTAPAAPAPARRAQGQRQGQNGPRAPRVVVCPISLETIKTPRSAPKAEFQGRQVPFKDDACKEAFEKLDEAGKEKAVKKATLMGRKLSIQKELETIEKQLKEMEAPAAVEKTDK